MELLTMLSLVLNPAGASALGSNTLGSFTTTMTDTIESWLSDGPSTTLSTFTATLRSPNYPSQHNSACSGYFATSTLGAKSCPVGDLRQYLSHVCTPVNSTRWYDLNAPCNAVHQIYDDCRFGEGGDSINHYPQSFETNRVCICQSQYKDMMAGCMACYREHGGTLGQHWWPREVWEPPLLMYCDATHDPDNYPMNRWIDWMRTLSSDSSRTLTDPLGMKTDVSLYYTPSMTGTANSVVMPKEGAGTWWLARADGTSFTYTSSHVVDGQIVATAALAQQGSEATAHASASAAGEEDEDATVSSGAKAISTVTCESVVGGALWLAVLGVIL